MAASPHVRTRALGWSRARRADLRASETAAAEVAAGSRALKEGVEEGWGIERDGSDRGSGGGALPFCMVR